MLSNMSEFGTKRVSESENLFSKKYKVTSEMSTPFLDENNNKMNKNITIDFVNDDCLAEIFTYVPACERPKIALVCQKWKKALEYSWSNVKKLQLTHWEYEEYSNCLKKYPTPDGKLSFLKSLLYKCGRFLTQLDLTAYGYSNIVPVINENCPNLVKLRLRFICDDDEIIHHKAFSRLSKLKVLSIIFQHMRYEGYQFMVHYIILALFPLANTLTDLILFDWQDDVSRERSVSCKFPGTTPFVFYFLKALKRFEFGGIQMFPQLEEYLRNNRILECSYYDRSLNENVIKPNEIMSITKLDLLRYKVSDDTLYTIANTMKQLTRLKIKCEWITNDGIVAISRMNNLKDLKLLGRNSSIDCSSIILLKNLINLMLPCSSKITDDLAMKVIENSPKIKMLFVAGTSVTVEFIKKAAEISRNRKQLLRTAVSFTTDKKQYESQYLQIFFCAIRNIK